MSNKRKIIINKNNNTFNEECAHQLFHNIKNIQNKFVFFFSREIARVLFLKNNLAISRKKYFSQPINNNESDPCIFLCDINQSNNDFFHNDSN